MMSREVQLRIKKGGRDLKAGMKGDLLRWGDGGGKRAHSGGNVGKEWVDRKMHSMHNAKRLVYAWYREV